MRVLSVCLACVLAACIQNPDPREPSAEHMQKTGFGGWIVIVHRAGDMLRGELLAVDSNSIWIETITKQTISIDLHDIRKAELFTYNSDWGFGLWGVLGTVSTVSHGFLLIFSVPLWILSSSIAAGAESHHVRLQIPEDSIDEFAKWARYPQGMPRQTMAKPSVTTHEEAWQLTKQAQHAARTNRCDVVLELDPRVRSLDKGLHESTFMRDEGIRRCFGLPSLLVPGPATPDAGVAP